MELGLPGFHVPQIPAPLMRYMLGPASSAPHGPPGVNHQNIVFQVLPTSLGKYEPAPDRWVVPLGSWRSQTLVAFRWVLPSGSAAIVELMAHHAVARGVGCEQLDALVLQQVLEAAAKHAAMECTLEVPCLFARFFHFATKAGSWGSESCPKSLDQPADPMLLSKSSGNPRCVENMHYVWES